MAYNNVEKPTSLFDISEHVSTILIGDVLHMDNNHKWELAIMGILSIKPTYAALGRKYGMDPRTVKKKHLAGMVLLKT